MQETADHWKNQIFHIFYLSYDHRIIRFAKDVQDQAHPLTQCQFPLNHINNVAPAYFLNNCRVDDSTNYLGK